MADPLADHALRPAELQAVVRAVNSGEPVLIYRGLVDALELRRLASGSRLTIGRRTESDIALSWDSAVSKVHAEVYELAGEWVVADDGLSSNGTFVNETRVSARHRLRDEDRLRVGRTTLVFRHLLPQKITKELFATTSPADELPQLSATRKRVLLELCRPVLLQANARPATNPEIASAVHLSTHAVKDHLGELARLLGHTNRKRGEQRTAIADTAIRRGLVSIRELS